MTEEEFHTLATLYLENAIEPSDLERFNRELSASADRVREFNDLRLLTGLIHEHGRPRDDLENVVEFSSKQSNFSSRPVPGLLLWHPLTSAAAGIIMGVLTTTIMWAYTGPKTPEVSRIALPLVDPGFEEVITPVPAVVPRTLNRWNGDPSHVVSSGDSAVTPKQGRSMLRMEPVDIRRYSRIEQIVDVSHLVPDEDAAVEFSASFFYDGVVDPCRMLLVLRAFTMDADEISGTTEKLDDQVSSGARKGVLIPAGSSDWHEGSLRMDLPANTKTLVFSIVAVDPPEASAGASRYIDEVEVKIVTTQSDQR